MTARPTILSGVSAVAIGNRALLLSGRPASGKSSLALALIDRGATLIGDDGVALEANASGQLIASPPPNIGGKLEIRGIGIVDLPTTSAAVALKLDLDREPERFPRELSQCEIAGHLIPQLPFDARPPDSALRAEWALRCHGLSI